MWAGMPLTDKRIRVSNTLPCQSTLLFDLLITCNTLCNVDVRVKINVGIIPQMNDCVWEKFDRYLPCTAAHDSHRLHLPSWTPAPLHRSNPRFQYQYSCFIFYCIVPSAEADLTPWCWWQHSPHLPVTSHCRSLWLPSQVASVTASPCLGCKVRQVCVRMRVHTWTVDVT